MESSRSIDLLCIVTLLLLSKSIVTSDRGTVGFLVLAPYADVGQADPNWKGGPGVIPAARLAVDRINNRTDILHGYTIKLLEGDSGCQHESKSAYSFVSNIFSDARRRSSAGRVVGVIGPESAILYWVLWGPETVSASSKYHLLLHHPR